MCRTFFLLKGAQGPNINLGAPLQRILNGGPALCIAPEISKVSTGLKRSNTVWSALRQRWCPFEGTETTPRSPEAQLASVALFQQPAGN